MWYWAHKWPSPSPFRIILKLIHLPMSPFPRHSPVQLSQYFPVYLYSPDHLQTNARLLSFFFLVLGNNLKGCDLFFINLFFLSPQMSISDIFVLSCFILLAAKITFYLKMVEPNSNKQMYIRFWKMAEWNENIAMFFFDLMPLSKLHKQLRNEEFTKRHYRKSYTLSSMLSDIFRLTARGIPA